MNRTVLLLFLILALGAEAADVVDVQVEAEEIVYRYENANNGAGPMWCSGSTSLVRSGKRVFVTALETLPDAKPFEQLPMGASRKDG